MDWKRKEYEYIIFKTHFQFFLIAISLLLCPQYHAIIITIDEKCPNVASQLRGEVNGKEGTATTYTEMSSLDLPFYTD